MGVISTKELMDRYYEDCKKGDRKNRNSIDNPTLYEYEEKIGKELVDMNVEEIIGLILEYRGKRKGEQIPYVSSYASVETIASVLRRIFEYYIDIQPIKNPLNNPKLKGQGLIKSFSSYGNKESFKWETVEDIIKKMHTDYNVERADYLELIILLFICGFSKAEEIVNLKDEMIDHKTKTATFNGKTIKFSDRCYYLLMKFKNIDGIELWRGLTPLISWNNSVFKLLIKPSGVDKLDERDSRYASNCINRQISISINDRYSVKFNNRILYFLGFYEYVAKKHGYDETNKMILSNRSNPIESIKHKEELLKLAEEYGISSVETISHLKRYLLPYVDAV